MAPPGDTEPKTGLTFDKPPKYPSKGFVFGSDKRICDVYCGIAEDGIGREVFRITINDNGDVIFRTRLRREQHESRAISKKAGSVQISHGHSFLKRTRLESESLIESTSVLSCRKIEAIRSIVKPVAVHISRQAAP